MKKLYLLLALLVGISTVRAAKPSTPVVVISSEVNEDAPHSLQKPTTPLSVVVQPGIFEEIGSIAASREVYPTGDVVAGLLQAALDPAKFLPGTESDADLVLVTHWGEISRNGPQLPVPGKPGSSYSMMRVLMMGRSVKPPFMAPSFASELNAEAKEDRYYLIVSAYDGKALRENKPLLVWQTRLSADSLRNHRKDVWPSMVAAGKSYFGQNLEVPVIDATTETVKLLDGQVAPVNVNQSLTDKLPKKREFL